MGIDRKKLEAVVDTFESGFENFPDFTIDMDTGYVKFDDYDEFPVCGCHAGFYGICSETVLPKERTWWEEFAHKLANSLGFESFWQLRRWAKDNPEIWGNGHGWDMFYNELAIGGYFDRFCDQDKIVINPEIILTHWQGVLERFIKYEEK